MRLLRTLLFPLRFLISLITYPLRLRARRRLLKAHGWTELWLEGEVLEIRPIERWAQDMLRRALRRREGPRVVLSRMRRFVAAFERDPHAKGVLARIGPLGGGWASADELRKLLLKIQRSGRQVLVFLDPGAGNKEMLVASAATRILMPPSGGLGATGTAAHGLFLAEPLAKAGVKVEVASVGRFKSAPEQFSRTERSASDREQTEALVTALDEALVSGLAEGERFDEASARRLLEASPLVGTHAHEQGFVQGLTYEEDLAEDVMTLAGLEEAPTLVGAGSYVDGQTVRSPFARKSKRVGIVEVHGGIVDQAPGLNPGKERMAVRKAVVDDLRAALADKSIGAVVLHVNSRGGSVTASEAIWAAVRRVDKDKPVIACFGDVAASGGYYVACGARSIIASPLTVTGSIGVFGMLPTWPELATRFGVGHDVIKNYPNAALIDPWAGLDERAKAHVQREVEGMYEDFVKKVSDARRLPVDDVKAAAQGRVWIGTAAREHHLLDGLGGVPEAVERAKSEAGGRFEAEPVLVRSLKSRPRPAPYEAEGGKSSVIGQASLHGLEHALEAPRPGVIAELLAAHPSGPLMSELVALTLTNRSMSRAVAWHPLAV